MVNDGLFVEGLRYLRFNMGKLTGERMTQDDPVAHVMTKPLSELRSSPDFVKLLNRSGRISFMGEQGLDALELDSLSDVVGKQWWDFWPVDQRAMLKARFEAAWAGEVQQFEVTRTMAQGTQKAWVVTLSAVPGMDGAVTSVLVVSQDVTQVP